MKVYNPQDIYNIAVVGHGSEGKTTLVEAFLFNSGATERMGRVEDGNTVTDYDPEETKRQFSISMGLAPVEWKNKKINFIDVPGYFDFEGEAVAAYELCDAALIVMSAKDTVSVGAEKAYAYCVKYGIPHAFVINQIDKENADFTKALAALQAKYAPAVTAVQLPVMQGGKFTGVVDIVGRQAAMFDGKTADVPGDLADTAASLREQLVENAAGNDEELMEKYFDGQELSKEDIEKGIKAGILQGALAPVFAAAAAPNLGVKSLMDEIIAMLPSAADMPEKEAKDKSGKEISVKRDPSAPFAAQVMKSIADPFVGKISIIKVFSGTLTSDMAVTNATTEKSEKASNMGVMRGKKLVNVDKLAAGDIGALAKLQNTATGDTLCAGNHIVKFDELEFPQPCISLAVVAKKQGDEEKVFAGLHRFEEEDPTFTVTNNPETGDMLVNGLGEMHLDVILNKLKNKFGAEGVLVEPRMPYRETIRKAAEAEGKHKKQSGGAGQFGVVQIRFEPIYDGPEFEFVNKIVGGVVPKEFIPAVEKGLKESMRHGVLAGYPMVNVRATLFDGKYHPVDSKEVAFKSAARLSYLAACEKADPVILEPIMKAEVVIPDEYMGDVIGDMNRRRGRILGMNPMEGGLQEVVAEVPMSEMTKYATDLRSMTQAKGIFKLTFERYEELPAQMAAKVIEQAKKDAEEEK